MNSENMARHAKAFGDAHSKAMKMDIGVYDESQCRECPHDHVCCSFIVACGPFEALGIIHHLMATHGPQGARSLLSLVKMRAKEMESHLKEYQDENGVSSEEEHTRMADDWFAKKTQCVFYNGRDKKCSIYEVRPIACRRVFGVKDCEKEGVRTAGGHEFAEFRRLTRIKITQGGPLEQHREMTTLISYLTGQVPLGMAPAEQEFLDKNPMMFSDDQHLWGLDGPPVQTNAIDQGV